MSHFPSAIKGLVFSPAMVCLFFLLKAFCPAGAGESCFADQFAVPIFLPLVAVYKIFGDSAVIFGQEFLFIMAYWALTGFLIGWVLDMLMHQRLSSETEIKQTLEERPSASSEIILPLRFVKPAPAPASVPMMKKPPINLLDREEYKTP